MVINGRDITVKLWELETGVLVRTFTGHTHKVVSLALSNDGKYVATASCDMIQL